MKSDLWLSENKIKNDVYDDFEKKRSEAQQRVASRRRDIESGAFEDQSAFMLHGGLSIQTDEQKKMETLISHLYKRPYFAHIQMMRNESDVEDYLLSDSESLETTLQTGDSQYLIPFKQDSNRPFLTALFHCYQSRNGREIKDKNGDISKPVLICDDEIRNGELLDAILLYSDNEQLSLDAIDELLAARLQENRNDPKLQNIISTLQRSQFEIIQDDVKSDFAVQGCAGSGKSQILLHRLFYLRDTLSDDNWNKVLLITPSALFRQYSADLVKRYGLSNVRNRSIAELYKSLLETYDSNFKGRQYIFEYTEEYLPDEYLHEVYSDNTISRVEQEIEKAIQTYVNNARELLKLKVSSDYSAYEINRLLEALQEKIELCDNSGSDDENTSEEELLKKLEDIKHKIEIREEEADHLDRLLKESILKKANFERMLTAFEEAKEERTTWVQQRHTRRRLINQNLEELEQIAYEDMDVAVPSLYARQKMLLKDIESGETFKRDEEYAGFLDSYCKDAEDDLLKYTDNENPVRYARRIQQEIEHISNTIKNNQEAVKMLVASADDINTSLDEISRKKTVTQEEGGEYRSKLTTARYYLQRIESAVFEREVWNALANIKSKYKIKTIEVEEGESGSKRSRILYKADLLFYLKIYEKIRSTTGLPQFTLLCVDEGQDLHKADYDLLRKLFPVAKFNIFGDVAQELHSDCGVQDWKKDTGTDKVYILNKNYRNASAIADFCNTQFGASMEYLGSIREENVPEIIDNRQTLYDASKKKDVVIIVKDRSEYSSFCDLIGCDESEFEYLDTNKSEIRTKKTKCYSIYSAKGLEFSRVLVFAKGMTPNQKLVACTRAMENLKYYE